MDNTQALSIYSDFNSSPYLSNVSNGSNGEKFTRRHDDVESYFTNNPSATSFSITGNQLGLSNGSENYKVFKFEHGNQINISDNYNYIPIKGQDKFAILKYQTNYFKITQTSVDSNENAKYKCELSIGNSDNFSEVCSNKGFGSTYTNDNITIVFGGAEFIVGSSSSAICFHKDTIINTDQGKIKIKHISNKNTIEGCKIVALIKSPQIPKKLVLIKKNAFGKNQPDKDTKITLSHEIVVNNRFIPAYKLIDNKNIFLINNDNTDVYNIIVVNKEGIPANNMYFGVISISEEKYKKIKHYKKKGMKLYRLKLIPRNKMLNEGILQLNLDSI